MAIGVYDEGSDLLCAPTHDGYMQGGVRLAIEPLGVEKNDLVGFLQGRVA